MPSVVMLNVIILNVLAPPCLCLSPSHSTLRMDYMKRDSSAKAKPVNIRLGHKYLPKQALHSCSLILRVIH
jgi:hypothetical protein